MGKFCDYQYDFMNKFKGPAGLSADMFFSITGGYLNVLWILAHWAQESTWATSPVFRHTPNNAGGIKYDKPSKNGLYFKGGADAPNKNGDDGTYRGYKNINNFAQDYAIFIAQPSYIKNGVAKLNKKTSGCRDFVTSLKKGGYMQGEGVNSVMDVFSNSVIPLAKEMWHIKTVEQGFSIRDENMASAENAEYISTYTGILYYVQSLLADLGLYYSIPNGEWDGYTDMAIYRFDCKVNPGHLQYSQKVKNGKVKNESYPYGAKARISPALIGALTEYHKKATANGTIGAKGNGHSSVTSLNLSGSYTTKEIQSILNTGYSKAPTVVQSRARTISTAFDKAGAETKMF